MTKLFLAPIIPGEPEVFLVGSFLDRAETGNTLFTKRIPTNFSYNNFCFVEDIEEADYVLVPHAIKDHSGKLDSYISNIREHAKKYGKRIIVFVGSDFSHDIFVDDAIVFKGSQYGYLKRQNEIIVPPFAEDLSEQEDLCIREKSQKPVIGFCGWAGFSTFRAYLIYLIRVFIIDVKKFFSFNKDTEVHKKGIYFRRKVLNLLSRSHLVVAHFIIRKSFSANKKTISLDPETARKEFLGNILNSDFTLAPKGDGNFSVRFYEALSLGRIPILIDTDLVMPLEWILDYSKFTITVPINEISRIDQFIANVYSSITNETFKGMQEEAREAYRKYLRYDSFFNYIFSQPLEDHLSSSNEYRTRSQT